ncbi:NlpC/P60 family protein [Streptomyces sp. NPDC001651]|uniref:C40 family peptidase n=1 Tax=Streptomyces sp. NPDC001651 TaxID=3364596 RepID=UPI0036C0A60F
MAPERTGMRNSALASAAALTSVALLGQSAGAAQADEGPSREEVSRRVSSLYDRAETDTGTFNATRASSTGPRNRAGAPPASGRDGDGGRGSAALDEVARQWFDVARSKLGPTVPAVLPKDRTPERSAPARSARPSGGDGAREISGRTVLGLPAGSGAPVAELTAGTARPAAMGELTAGPVAALPAPATPAHESGAALALPAPAAAQPETDQRSPLRASKERSRRKLAQARELLSTRAGRTTPALEAPAAAPAPFPPAAQTRWDALEAQSPADLTTVPPGTTAPTDTSFGSGAEPSAPQSFAAPDTGFAGAGQTGSFPPVGQTGSYPAVGQTGSYPAVGQTGSFPMVDQTGSFPAVAQTGSFPAVAQIGSFPAVDQTGGFPAVTQTGGFPTVTQAEGFPTAPQSGSYPTIGQTGSFPAAAQTGAYAAVDQTGGIPTVAQTGSYPTASQTGSFPMVDQTGDFPAGTRTGGLPTAPQTESYPAVDQTGGIPTVAQTGGYPMAAQTGSFPMVDQTGGFPVVDPTGGFPVVDQTGGYQTGSFPAVAQTGSYPAAAPAPAAPAASAAASRDSRAVRALEFARAQVGKPCVWGTTGPNTFDGPGLTQAAWKAAGIALPRTAQEQATAGQGVALTHLEPGDLVLFHAGHVGVYSGNGMMIHAPGPGTVIREESIQYAGEAAIHSAIRPA